MSAGRVVAVFLCAGHRQPLSEVAEATAEAGLGLTGDRHARPGSSRQVLLMEQEVLDLLRLQPGDVRENLTVTGLGLQSLPGGRRLRAGEALLEITGACGPCGRMDEIRPGLKSELKGRRGVLARVLEGGKIRGGDPVELLQEEPLIKR